MSIRARGDGWQLDYYDEHGTRQRITVQSPTKAGAQRMLDEIKLDVSRRKRGLGGESPNPRRMTIGEVARWWLDGPMKARANRSHIHDAVRVRIIDRAIGQMQADRVSGPVVERWLDELEAAGYAPATITHSRAHLSAMLNRAMRSGLLLLSVNPVVHTKPRRTPQVHRDVLTPDEVARVLDVRKDPLKAIYATAVFTGMRRGEIWGLRRQDVDFERGVITVHRSHTRQATKTGRVRLVPIHPDLRPHLARILLSHTSEFVFPGRDGDARSAEAKTSRDFKAALKAAGVSKDLRFHDLRHTCATLLLRAGASLSDVQRLLGHSSPVVTANVYAHLTVDDIRTAVSRLKIGDHQVTGEESQAPTMSPKSLRGDA